MPFIWRYGIAFVGGFLAMAAHIYWLYGRGEWLAPQRLSATIGNALIFAHLIAFTVVIARDLTFKPAWVRHSVSIVSGTLLGVITWYAHLYLFLFQTRPNLPTLVAGGFGLSFGFFVSGFEAVRSDRTRLALATIFTVACIYLPVYLTHRSYTADAASQALLYFQADNPRDVLLIGLPFALIIAFFGNLPLLLNSSQRVAH